MFDIWIAVSAVVRICRGTWVNLQNIHCQIESRKCPQTPDSEKDSISIQEAQESVGGSMLVTGGSIQMPHQAGSIYERVYLKMHSKAQDNASPGNVPLQDSQEQTRSKNAEQALAAPARAYASHDGVQQPDGGVLCCRTGGEPIMLGQDAHEQPAGQDVGGGEEHLAKLEPQRRRHEQPGQQRRVAVRVAGVGRGAVGDEAGGIREDEVVNVGVLDGRVGVLVAAPRDEAGAQEDGSGEDGGGVAEKLAGHGADGSLRRPQRPITAAYRRRIGNR